MAIAARYPGPMNFALPIPTGQVVAYIRKPEEFKLNQYCQYVNVPAPSGTWQELDRDQPIRVVTTEEFAWAPGDKSPDGNTNISNFVLKEYRCQRYAPSFTIDDDTAELHRRHGGWDIDTYEAMQIASQLMTHRTRRFWALAGTTGTWTGFTQSATAIGGGRWDAGTSTTPYLQKGLMEAFRIIRLNTNGRARLEDMRLILNPQDAIKIRASAEITDYMKGSPFSYPAITGELIKNPNQGYGLPPDLYGIPVVVEDAAYVSTRPIDAPTSTGQGTRAHIKAADQAVLLYRPGGMDAPFGVKSFCTIQMFYYKYEMSVEGTHDAWNKRSHGRVVDWSTFVATAVPSGYEITDITS